MFFFAFFLPFCFIFSCARTTYNSWQPSDNTLTTPWQHLNNTLTTLSLTTPWQHPDNTLTTPWQHLDNTLTATSSPQVPGYPHGGPSPATAATQTSTSGNRDPFAAVTASGRKATGLRWGSHGRRSGKARRSLMTTAKNGGSGDIGSSGQSPTKKQRNIEPSRYDGECKEDVLISNLLVIMSVQKGLIVL